MYIHTYDTADARQVGWEKTALLVYIYVYIHIYIQCMCIYTYIHIYIRMKQLTPDRWGDKTALLDSYFIYTCVCIYI